MGLYLVCPARDERGKDVQESPLLIRLIWVWETNDDPVEDAIANYGGEAFSTPASALSSSPSFFSTFLLSLVPLAWVINLTSSAEFFLPASSSSTSPLFAIKFRLGYDRKLPHQKLEKDIEEERFGQQEWPEMLIRIMVGQEGELNPIMYNRFSSPRLSLYVQYKRVVA